MRAISGLFSGKPKTSLGFGLRTGPISSHFPIGIMDYNWPTLHFEQPSNCIRQGITAHHMELTAVGIENGHGFALVASYTRHFFR